ncbi:MAG: hypothetical protein SNH63_07260 [Rikenellaceae bacterium]
MNSLVRFYLILFLSLASLSACNQEEMGEVVVEVEVDDSSQRLIPCTLKYSVSDMEAGTAESKALTRGDVDMDGIVSDVKNVLVVQFDGAEESSTVSRVDYVTDLLDPEVMLIETRVKTIIIFIANTFGDSGITLGQTLSEVKSMGVTLSGNMTTTTNGIIYDENLVKIDNDIKYFIQSDCKIYDSGIESGEDIEINFQRNVAKITLNIKNGWEGQTLTNVRISSMPSTYLYYANRKTEEDTPIVPATVSSTISYTEKVNSVGSSDLPVTTLSFYVPVNMRGYDDTSSAYTKPNSTCATGATYATITFGYTKEDDSGAEVECTIVYKLYLGADLEKDFNLCPNTYYAYNINILGMSSDEEIAADARITIVKKIDAGDYTTRKSSNCYILNPGTSEMVYYIPVSPRINEYWGSSYADVSDNCISDADIVNWEEDSSNYNFELLWYDNANNPYSSTSSSLDANQLAIEKVEVDGIASLKVTLGAGFDNVGNILVAIKKSDTILWSWHLWITDYNPYDHELTATAAGAYALENGTGSLHRYDGSVWEDGGIYADKYIMDRNIGARSVDPTTTDGFLYYQFGRKDPFPYTGNAKTAAGVISNFTTASGSVAMTTAVYKPTVYYTASANWCNEYTSESYLWNDQYIPKATTSTGKSIFDPSPYGFRLPIYAVWGNFTIINFLANGKTANAAGYGFYYQYNGTDHKELYYPACGYIPSNNGTFVEIGNNTAPWGLLGSFSSTPESLSRGYLLYAGNSYASLFPPTTQAAFNRASGTSIRSIEDEEEEEEEECTP